MPVCLIPASLTLVALGLAAFVWALESRQFDDPKDDAARILREGRDDRPDA